MQEQTRVESPKWARISIEIYCVSEVAPQLRENEIHFSVCSAWTTVTHMGKKSDPCLTSYTKHPFLIIQRLSCEMQTSTSFGSKKEASLITSD